MIRRPDLLSAGLTIGRKETRSLAGYAYPTPSTHCWPSGVPYIFFQLGMQMLQQPNEITFLYLRDHEIPPRAPKPASSSAGGAVVVRRFRGVLRRRYFGDRHRRRQDRSALGHADAVQPSFARCGTLPAARLRGCEGRIRTGQKRELSIPNTSMQRDPDYKGKYLQLLFTVEDRGVFTMPWSATITYARRLGEWVNMFALRGPKTRTIPPERKPSSQPRIGQTSTSTLAVAVLAGRKQAAGVRANRPTSCRWSHAIKVTQSALEGRRQVFQVRAYPGQ
jgi:hypothetical protein